MYTHKRTTGAKVLREGGERALNLQECSCNGYLFPFLRPFFSRLFLYPILIRFDSSSPFLCHVLFIHLVFFYALVDCDCVRFSLLRSALSRFRFIDFVRILLTCCCQTRTQLILLVFWQNCDSRRFAFKWLHYTQFK